VVPGLEVRQTGHAAGTLALQRRPTAGCPAGSTVFQLQHVAVCQYPAGELRAGRRDCFTATERAPGDASYEDLWRFAVTSYHAVQAASPSLSMAWEAPVCWTAQCQPVH
jgi:hypothetical protein